MTDRLSGSLLGVAVGDALGIALEFKDREAIVAEHGDEPVREMLGGGWSSAIAGATTDDTDMTYILLSRLLDDEGYDRVRVAEAYLDWAASGSPYVGGIIMGSLRLLNEGAPLEEAARRWHDATGKSAGNGTLMRVAPLIVRYLDDPDRMAAFVEADSTITHYDPLVTSSAVAYARALADALEGGDGRVPCPDPLVSETLYGEVEGARRRMENETGYVLAGLAAANLALRAEGFEEGMVEVVNRGGDADTNGAIAGAVLGARFGASGIPDRWLRDLRPPEGFLETVERLVASVR